MSSSYSYFRFVRMAAPCNETDALIGNSSYQSAKAPSLPDNIGGDHETIVASVNSIWHSKFSKKTNGILAMLVFIACVIFSYHIGLDKAGASANIVGEMRAPALKGQGGPPQGDLVNNFDPDLLDGPGMCPCSACPWGCPTFYCRRYC